MIEFIRALEAEFEKYADSKNAVWQKKYMRNQFDFLGIKAPKRKQIQSPFIVKKYLPPKVDLSEIVNVLWSKPQREFQYFAQELVFKYDKIEEKDIELYEFMVVHKSWWDTIDFVAPKLIGNYFKVYNQNRNRYVEKWLETDNIWLKRSAILFQLNYKKDLDTDFLGFVISKLLNSEEFFINKAIGWILRNYSRVEPNWVLNFVENTKLNSLSKREAIRLMI